MSFATKQSDKFSNVFDRSPYYANDPLVKLQYAPKGNNVIFGRAVSGEDYDKLVYVGKVFENTAGKNVSLQPPATIGGLRGGSSPVAEQARRAFSISVRGSWPRSLRVR